MKTDAYAENSGSTSQERERILGPATRSLLLTALLVLSFKPIADGAVIDDLQAEITSLKAEVTRLQTAIRVERDQAILAMDALNALTAPPLSLTGGTAFGARGGTAEVPMYFKASTAPVAAIQFDVRYSTGIRVTSVAPGLAALAADKSVVGAEQGPGRYRVLIFGINVNVIPSGPLALLSVNIGNQTRGTIPMTLEGVSCSDPDGNAVVPIVRSGSLTSR